MSVATQITSFIADAQYQIGQLTYKIDELKDRNNADEQMADFQTKRLQLYAFLFFVYEDRVNIHDGTNFLNWTDKQVIEEIQYLRWKCGMDDFPNLSWVGHRPVTGIQNVESATNTALPEGTNGQILEFNVSGNLIATHLNKFGGMAADAISQYFNTGIPANFRLKYFLHPTYTSSDWTSLNPTLGRGEIGFEAELEGGVLVPKRFKIGPGAWNSLSYFTLGEYTYTDVPTNPIGDAKDVDLSGTSFDDMFNKMLNPYQTPAISALTNNAGGSYSNAWQLEIGTSLTGSVSLNYSISNSANLNGATPINVSAGGEFTNEGSFANGLIALTIGTSINPSTLKTITIAVTATHTNGTTSAVNTTIDWFPKIIWGTNSSTTINEAGINGLTGKNGLITNDYANDYIFTTSGYLWICIPTMLSISDINFALVTNPLAPQEIDMFDYGTVAAVNNGVGTYDYHCYRSLYNLTSTDHTLRVA